MSEFLLWLKSIGITVRESLKKDFRVVLRDFIKNIIVFVVVTMVHMYNFLYEHGKGIAEAAIAAIIASIVITHLL